MEDKVKCPLVDEKIDPFQCMENRDIKEQFILPKFKEKPNWKEICKNCIYQDY